MLTWSHTPTRNALLAALSAPEQERLFPLLELVPMPLGKVLCESGNRLGHVYFPTDCIVSLLYVMQDAGLIRYSRGRITVPDRARLEQRVCECYAVVRKEFTRLLPYLQPPR